MPGDTLSPPSRLTDGVVGRTDPALDFSIFDPAGGHPKEVRGRDNHGELQEAQSNQQTQPATDSPSGPGPRLLGPRKGVSPLFDLVSSFHQIKAHKDTVSLTAFCTPTGLYEWLVMPQGSSASPGWFVKVINEVIKDLTQVAAYLGDVIVFDSDPIAHV